MSRALLLFMLAGAARAAEPPQLLVYGGTPGGVAAALEAGRAGRRVTLAEPYTFVGGMTTNGLTHPDFRTFEARTGVFLEQNRRVLDYYRKKYGPDSPQARDCRDGTHAEPRVNRLVWEAMLKEVPTIEVLTRHRLIDAQRDGARLRSAAFDHAGERVTLTAAAFIDASYEGDLMAAAGVPYRVGREGRAEYGESLAPEAPDGQVQGYNFRLTMTDDPANRREPWAPPGYRRKDFLPALGLFASGRLKSAFGTKDAAYKLQIPLPNRKHDVNDVSGSALRLSLPEVSPRWPDGTPAEREAVFAEHVRHNFGLLYFLQTDDVVPAKLRDEARSWGLCRDEFSETEGRPEQLYVREARRMRGRATFTQCDTDHAPGDARAKFVPDAVAMGDYGPNCHGTAHVGPRLGGRHAGEFYHPCPPYQIPFGVMVPEGVDNLLVPVACSASHAGFCALRLEPIWASLGQAAGAAVAEANGGPLPAVDPAKVRRRLHAAGAATLYLADVREGSPDFAAAQWWGALGGFHGLDPAPAKPGARGANVVGQYYAAFPGHAAELGAPLTAELRGRWAAFAGRDFPDAATRGDFVRRAFRAANP